MTNELTRHESDARGGVRRPGRRLLALATTAALLAIGGVATAPAAGASQPASTPDDSAPAPTQGGHLTVLVHSDGGSSMDPARSLIHSTTSSMPLAAVYDLLVFIDPISGEVETRMAEILTSNEDGSVWTLEIKPGIEFSDGTPFDAHAVQAEIERLADPETAAAAINEAQAVTTTLVDDLTLEFRPDTPNLNYDYVIALDFTMIPSPTAVAADPENFGQNPVGAGPFLLTDWVVGQTKMFERNPNFWEEGKPYLDSLETVLVADQQQQINRVVAGDADLISNQTGELFQLARDNDLDVVTGGKLSGGFVWNFNHAVAPFDDVRARRVFQYVVDNPEMNELLFPAGGIETPVNLFSVDSPMYDSSLDLAPTNPEEAQRLLDEIAAEGEPLSFELTTRTGQPTLSYAEFAQAAFAEYDNVEVSVRALEPNDYLAAVRGGEYSAAYYTGWWSAPYPVFHQIYGTDAPLNYSNYSNPDVDALLADATQTTDAAEKADIYGEIVALMNEDVAVIPFQVAEVGFIRSDRVHGLRGVHLGNTPIWADVYLSD